MIETTDALLRAITEATAGLFFPSESDFPIEPFTFGPNEPTLEGVCTALGVDASRRVEEISLPTLFEGLMEAPEGASERDQASALRFSALFQLLDGELASLRVYRVGEVDIDVVAIGRDAAGDWIGIKTHVVET